MHDDAKKFETVVVALGDLEPPYPRAIDERRVEHLVEDIREHGLKEPLLITSDSIPPEKWYVVDGLHRLEALRRLGWSTTHAVWSPTLVPEDTRARVLWRGRPPEVERVWVLIVRAARSLEVPAEEAHGFLFDLVQALQRAKSVFGDVPVNEAVRLARAALEEVEGDAAPSTSSLHEAIALIGSDRAQITSLHLSEAGIPDWAEFLHGRLRLLVLPTSYLEKAVRNGISSSMLFALKAAHDGGAPDALIEAYLEHPTGENLKRLESWLSDGKEGKQEPATALITKTKKLARLIRRKLRDTQDPGLLSRLSEVLSEAEKILEEATT